MLKTTTKTKVKYRKEVLKWNTKNLPFNFQFNFFPKTSKIIPRILEFIFSLFFKILMTFDTIFKYFITSGHRGEISGLAFRTGTHTLYSSSHDRLVYIIKQDIRIYIYILPIAGQTA